MTKQILPLASGVVARKGEEGELCRPEAAFCDAKPRFNVTSEPGYCVSANHSLN